MGNVAGLTGLDVASGNMLGIDPRPPLPSLPPSVTPLDVLGDLLEPALATGRCLVSFSGGRDSSATLAIATETARRRGLPDPLPVTFRYPDAPAAQEDDYQELVIRHLRLDDWERIEIRREFEAVGPIAQQTLARHGILFPSNAYTTVPILDRAGGGVVVLGVGPSDFYAYWRFAALADLLLGNRRPRRSDLKLLGFGAMPRPARATLIRRSGALTPLPWLRPAAADRVIREMAAQGARAPMRFDRSLLVNRLHRCFAGTLRSLDALAAAAGAEILVASLDPRYLAALVAHGGRRGWGDRAAAVRALAGDLLPAQILARRDRTNMQQVMFGEHTRAFAERWSGDGLDESLVVPELLRELWLGERQDWRSAALMQLAWLHDELRRERSAPAEGIAGAPATVTSNA